MSVKKYALIVENEVFDIINVSESSPMAKEIHDGFTNSPMGMSVTEFKNVSIGWEWDGEKFINTSSNQIDNIYPDNSEVYAFLSNNKVFFLMFIPNGKTLSAMYKAAFGASPTAMYLSDNFNDVAVGDIWNGKKFTRVRAK